MPISVGDQLGAYRILALLGAGGMGEVYRASDTRLGREVALKLLPPDMAADADRLARFEREARAAAALNHPNIVTLYSVEQVEGVHFLTMELVDGRPLQEMIAPEGLPARRVVELAVAMAEAVAAAHDKDLVHRDLKPANIMITPDGRVKLLDFGLAKMVRAADPDGATRADVHQTQYGVVMGTPAYMSPEQISGAAVDHRTDIFALGTILYEMLTGGRPFRGATQMQLAASILRDPMPAISRPGVPGGLSDLVERCLAKNPDERVASARLLAQGLQSIEVGSGPLSTATSTFEGFWVAVAPFKCTGSSGDLGALAEGLTEEISAGLSRFSYLRVLTKGTAGARYVLEGSLRQAGSQLRAAPTLIDTATGTTLWAENYARAYSTDRIFEIQDDLVARIVATCADQYGVLPRSISDVVRGTDPTRWSPYEALMQFFGYHQRLTPADHRDARTGLERAVEIAPRNADCWAMLSLVYAHEHGHGFNPLPNALDRAVSAARRAVDLAPGNHLTHAALATALLFRKEIAACRHEAERAIALNPLDAGCHADMGANLAFAGDWDRGCALIERAMELNPQHPVWYRGMLSFREYVKANYRAAVDEAVKTNAPDLFWMQAVLAAAHGQLGEQEAAASALRRLTALVPGFAAEPRAILGTWLQSRDVDHFLEGLRKAGLSSDVTS
jgi:serine/threonine protein kinase